MILARRFNLQLFPGHAPQRALGRDMADKNTTGIAGNADSEGAEPGIGD